jgi:hypothetical protein
MAMELNKTNALVLSIAAIFIVAGVGYYLGWFDEYLDKIPWWGDTGDLKVTVYDAMNTTNTTDDVPLANVTITVLSTELVKKTDSNGTALFEDIDVGSYEVQAEHNSVTLNKTVEITKDALTTVTFYFNESAS